MNKEFLENYVKRRIKSAELSYPCNKTWKFYYDNYYICSFEIDINNKITIHNIQNEKNWNRKLKLEKIKKI